MSDIELVGCAIADRNRHVLLLHRGDHNQWQLPGGRMLRGESPLEAVARHALDELNVRVKAQRYLGRTTFIQGGVEYGCGWWQAVDFENQPILGDVDVYDDAQYHNLYKYWIGRIGLSPNVENFKNDLQNGEFHLMPTNLVQ